METITNKTTTRKNEYNSNINIAQSKLSQTKKRILLISSARLCVFVGGATFAWFAFPFSFGDWMICIAIIVLFLRFLIIHNRLYFRKEWLETTIKVNENELKALDYDFSAFGEGKEFIDSSHAYTFDLDVFGNRSLYQSINRTTTWFGSEALALLLSNPPTKEETIKQRQESVGELCEQKDFRQDIYVEGLLKESNEKDHLDLKTWIKSPTFFSKSVFFKTLIWLIPALNAILICLALLGVTTWGTFGYAFMCFALMTFSAQKRISGLHFSYGKKLSILAKYAKLIHRFEELPVESKLLQAMQATLNTDGQKASVRLRKFASYLNSLDQRNNILVSVILDGLFCWQIRTVINIEQWKEKNASHLLPWLSTLGDLEALCSLATFAYNNPDAAYPTITSQSFRLTGRSLRHPLMPRECCVANPVEIPECPFFVIITGANMAGKSTYLRTIGINYLLACVGAPICGDDLRLSPANLITSLRTSDSLADGESYFFAELKRMKQIIDRLQRGEKLFILLDEILRGTNSKDKQKGSFAFIRQLMQFGTNGVIATHDTQLGRLAEDFPGKIKNYRFEADIRDNELKFSYMIREGIACNMNACFLMKKMGIEMDE